MNRRFPKLLMALLVATTALNSFANSPPPIRKGPPVQDPAGLEYAVSRSLELDLRPVAERAPARLRATWRLRVETPTTQPVSFGVAPNLAVTLDGQRVAFTALEDGPPLPAVPEGFAPPDLDGHRPLLGAGPTRATVTGSLALAPGEHTVVAEFDATPTDHHGLSAAIVHGFVWAFAPTGRAACTVRVNAPAGWRIGTEPTLSAEAADVWTGVLPSSTRAFGVTFAAPVSDLYSVTEVIAWVLGGLVLVAGGLLVWRAARRAVVAGRSPWGAGILAWLLWLALLIGASALIGAAPRLGLGLAADQVGHQGYRGVGIAVLGFLAALGSLVATLVMIPIARRVARRR